MIRPRASVLGLTLMLALPAGGQENARAPSAERSADEMPLLLPAGSTIELVTTSGISSRKNVKGTSSI